MWTAPCTIGCTDGSFVDKYLTNFTLKTIKFHKHLHSLNISGHFSLKLNLFMKMIKKNTFELISDMRMVNKNIVWKCGTVMVKVWVGTILPVVFQRSSFARLKKLSNFSWCKVVFVIWTDMYSPIISHYFISHIAVVHYKPNTFSSMNQGILQYEIY